MAKGTRNTALTYVGLDVHRDTISAAVLDGSHDRIEVQRLAHDDVSVRRFVDSFGDRARIRACYEAGPTGYELQRLLTSLGVSCSVIAPSMIPVAPGDKVKTDKRDAKRLARLLRADELVAIRVPIPAEEAVRDLCRARAALVADRRRARQRVVSFLLRHGQVYRAGSSWTQRHREWLDSRRFDDAALSATYQRYLAVATIRAADVAAVEDELDVWFRAPIFADPVARLSAYRGIDRLGALHLATEVCDWRRFATAPQFMAFCGLVPCEHSSGRREWRGSLTRAGNVHVRTQLVESAWAYRYPPRCNRALIARQDGLEPAVIARAWKAQLRLSRRFRQLDARKAVRGVVCAAVARELAGFVWTEMTQ